MSKINKFNIGDIIRTDFYNRYRNHHAWFRSIVVEYTKPDTVKLCVLDTSLVGVYTINDVYRFSSQAVNDNSKLDSDYQATLKLKNLYE
jgi:hypothetical protein